MIVCGIASILSRLPQLVNTVNSLLPQVDKINISLNHYIGIPDELKHEKIEAALTQGSDEQKFRKVEGDIFLSADDDLIFPPDYVARIKQAFEDYENVAKYTSTGATHILTFHGRSFDSFPITSYYKSKSRKYRCLDKVANDVTVQIGGTGCMAFKVREDCYIPSGFSVSLLDFQYPYMADIQLAIKAKRENKRIVCLAHESGWIKYQQVNGTIYDRFRDDDRLQTSLVNSNFGIKETV